MFFDGSSSGRLSVNRDDHDGGASYPIHVGTSTSNGNGAYLTTGGAWTNGSSREFKESFESLDGLDILDRISRLPMEAWEYKGTGERHIWPCAEDFHEVFDVGVPLDNNNRDSKYLSAADIAGVALIGVNQLYQLIQDRNQSDQVLLAKSKQIQRLEEEIADLRSLVNSIVATLGAEGQSSTQLSFESIVPPVGLKSASVGRVKPRQIISSTFL